MADPSTTPNEVAVPKVVPMKETFWQKFKRSQRVSGERMKKVRDKEKVTYDPARSIRKDRP